MTNVDVKVAELLEKYKVVSPPVPIEVIANGEGAVIARNHFEGPQSGFALRSASGEWVIGVNTSTSPRRQRFTIAHELGHLLLHEGELILDYFIRTHFKDDQAADVQPRGSQVRVSFRDDVSSLATNSEEIEANRFAAEILMPRRMILASARNILRSMSVTRDELVSRLAEDFNVSPEAMGYRLVNLTILVP